MTRLNVILPDTLVSDLRRHVPRRQRSQFVGAAVRERLDQLLQRAAAEAAAGCWADRGETDAGDEVRRLREGWDVRQGRAAAAAGARRG